MASMVDWQSSIDLLLPLVALDGAFVISRSEEALAALRHFQLEVLSIGSQTLLAFLPRQKQMNVTTKLAKSSLRGQEIMIVVSLCLGGYLN